jgi:hypothetical protein
MEKLAPWLPTRISQTAASSVGFEPGIYTFALLEDGERTGKLMLADGAAVSLALNILALSSIQRRLSLKERTALTAALLQRPSADKP